MQLVEENSFFKIFIDDIDKDNKTWNISYKFNNKNEKTKKPSNDCYIKRELSDESFSITF